MRKRDTGKVENRRGDESFSRNILRAAQLSLLGFPCVDIRTNA